MHIDCVYGICVILGYSIDCFPLNRINRLVFIIVMKGVYCEVVTEFLSVI
jgi:hypothetical protein